MSCQSDCNNTLGQGAFLSRVLMKSYKSSTDASKKYMDLWLKSKPISLMESSNYKILIRNSSLGADVCYDVYCF